MLSLINAARMVLQGKSSLSSKIVSILLYVIAEAVFIAFMAWCFFTSLWYLEN
jgi:hypothetical protein